MSPYIKSTHSIPFINKQLKHIADWKQALARGSEQAVAHLEDMRDRNQKNLIRMRDLAHRIERLQRRLNDLR